MKGDGLIDHEEFEYVLSEFGVSERNARQAFTIFTQVESRKTLPMHLFLSFLIDNVYWGHVKHLPTLNVWFFKGRDE